MTILRKRGIKKLSDQEIQDVESEAFHYLLPEYP